MEKPKISIIVPVYKTEKYLNRCVDSILSQDFKDFELILVDDGSPDNSGKICDDYSKKDNRIKVIHKENGGLSSARNEGLKIAFGEYIAFVDSDDYVESNYLKVLSSHIKDDSDIIIGSIYWEDAVTGKKSKQEKIESHILLKADFSKELPSLLEQKRLNYVHGKAYKKETIDKNNITFQDDQLTSAEDTVFNFTMLTVAKSLSLDSDYIHNYIVNYPSTTLAGKFYPDRYDRFTRLQDFISDCAEKIGCLNDEMISQIESRRIVSATWVLEGTLNADISKKEKIYIMNKILNNPKLVASLETEKEKFNGGQFDAMRSKNARILLKFYDEMEYGKGLKGKIKKIFKR